MMLLEGNRTVVNIHYLTPGEYYLFRVRRAPYIWIMEHVADSYKNPKYPMCFFSDEDGYLCDKGGFGTYYSNLREEDLTIFTLTPLEKAWYDKNVEIFKKLSYRDRNYHNRNNKNFITLKQFKLIYEDYPIF